MTGEDADDFAEGTPIVDELVHLHEDMGIYTLAAAVTTLVSLIVVQPKALFGGGSELNKVPVSAVRWGVAALALTAAVLVAWTAHLGGIMVWGVPR